MPMLLDALMPSTQLMPCNFIFHRHPKRQKELLEDFDQSAPTMPSNDMLLVLMDF